MPTIYFISKNHETSDLKAEIWEKATITTKKCQKRALPLLFLEMKGALSIKGKRKKDTTVDSRESNAPAKGT